MRSHLGFDHGETTCAYAVGKFCIFLRSKNFGDNHTCSLFNDEPIFADDKGWLSRCEPCMDYFGPGKEENV